MTNIIFTFFVTLYSNSAQSQVIQQRRLEVDPSNVEKFEAVVAKKNQIYYSKDGQPRYVTFQILTGPNAYNYVRMQIAESFAEFDEVDQEGNDFWQKTVGPLHLSKGNSIWWVNSEITFNPEMRNKYNHRRIIYYKIKDEGLDDFWKYRERAKKVWTEMGIENRVSVMNCMSGCDGNWVQVRFHHKNFTSEEQSWERMPEFEKKFNEIFGDGSLEGDQDRLRASLMPDGRRIRHYK